MPAAILSRSMIIVMNPYNPPTQTRVVPVTGRRWLRRFLILNAVCITVPVLLFLAVFLWIEFSITSRFQPSNGDPVLYDHVFSLEMDPWMAALYLSIPNAILLVFFLHWYFGSKRIPSTRDAGE